MSRSYGGTLQRGSSNAPESADRMLLAWRYPLGSPLYQRPRVRRSLQTSDPKVAAQRRKSAQERVIADKFGDATRDFVEVVEAWSQWISVQVGRGPAERYACSLDQLQPYLDGKTLSAIDARLVSEIVQARAAAGVIQRHHQARLSGAILSR